MFQNIQEEVENQTKEETKKETKTRKDILTNVISKKYILLYIITFMVSCIGLGQEVSPFALAMIVAVISNEIPVVAILAIGLVGNIIGCGAGSILYYVITLLIFFASFFIIEPKYNDESRNEKVKLGGRIFVASLTVGIVKTLISGFLIYDLLVAVVNSMLIYILYKVFVNSITVITNFNENNGSRCTINSSCMCNRRFCNIRIFCKKYNSNIYSFSTRLEKWNVSWNNCRGNDRCNTRDNNW